MTAYESGVKWPIGATAQEILAALRIDVPCMAVMLMDTQGIAADDLLDVFEQAIDAVTEHAG